MILFSKSQKLLEPISFHREGIADDKHDGIKGVQVGAPLTLQPPGIGGWAWGGGGGERRHTFSCLCRYELSNCFYVFSFVRSTPRLWLPTSPLLEKAGHRAAGEGQPVLFCEDQVSLIIKELTGHVMVLGTRDLGNVTENHHRTPIPGTCQNPTSDPGTLSESWLSFLRAITLNSFFLLLI